MVGNEQDAEVAAATTDTLRLSPNEVRGRPPLSARAERELFQRLERGDLAARDTLVRSNLGLVVSIAARHRAAPVPFVDLVQEGALGLIRAVDGFEWRRGYRFSTYATWWIRHAIRRAIANTSRPIRLPVSLGERAWRIERAERRETARLGREPDERELADAVRLGVEQLRAVRQAPRVVASLDQPVSSTDPMPLGSLLPGEGDDPAETSLLDLERASLHAALRQALTHLPTADRRVLELRFGLAPAGPMTLAAIGRRIGLSRERVRQIESAALERLARDPELQGLRPAA